MSFVKKSLGQNFLIDKNIIKKIINLVDINNRNVIEIGPGRGALTEEILAKKPRSLILVEKDLNLSKKLKFKYFNNKIINVLNNDILKLNLEKTIKNNSIIFGNLPYNISSQILVKVLKLDNLKNKLSNIIFMFQKELGQKIIGEYQSPNYGRLSILTNYKLNFVQKFFVSRNCFTPKPKVTSMIIHFIPKFSSKHRISNLHTLEKVTNIIFSKKRKMINKSLKNLLDDFQINNIKGLKLNSRPSDLKPEIYFKIAELIDKSN